MCPADHAKKHLDSLPSTIAKEKDGVHAFDKPSILVDSGDDSEGLVPKIASADLVSGCLAAFNGLSGPWHLELGKGKRNSDSEGTDLVSLSYNVGGLYNAEASSLCPDAG